MFEKIATSPLLNKIGKFGKWNKLPRLATAWQATGGINVYDDTKKIIDRDARSLLNLGPDFRPLPGMKTIDLTNIGGGEDEEGRPKPGTDVGSLYRGGTPYSYDKGHGEMPSLDQIMQQQGKDSSSEYFQWLKDAEKQQDIDNYNKDVKTKEKTSKQQVDAEAELKKQQQKVKNIKLNWD